GYAPEGGGLAYGDSVSTLELLQLPTPEIARAMIDSTGNIRTASMVFAAKRVLEQRTVLLVSKGIDSHLARSIGFADGFAKIDEAVAYARSLKGPGATMTTCFPRGIEWRIMPWREG